MWRFSCPCTTGSKFRDLLTSLQVVHNRWQYWSGSYPELEILHTIFSPSLFRAFQALLYQLDSSENSVLKVKSNQGGFGSFCQGFRVRWLTRAQQQNFTSCLALERQHALQGKPFRVLVRLHFTRKWWHLRDRWIFLNFHLPYIFHQEFLNKVFCQVTGIAEKFFIEFIIHSCDVGKRFLFSFSKERWCTTKAREARKKNGKEKWKINSRGPLMKSQWLCNILIGHLWTLCCSSRAMWERTGPASALYICADESDSFWKSLKQH